MRTMHLELSLRINKIGYATTEKHKVRRKHSCANSRRLRKNVSVNYQKRRQRVNSKSANSRSARIKRARTRGSA